MENMLDRIYNLQENQLDEIIIKKTNELKENCFEVNINKIKKESYSKEELKNILDQMEDKYNKKISSLNKEFYKKGFIDGTNLMINCLEK